MANYWETLWQDYMGQHPTYSQARANLPIPEWGEEAPQASYNLWRKYQGGTKPYQDWLARDYNRQYAEYTSAALLDPFLQWQDYLEGLQPSTEFKNISPYERGERPSAFVGRARWIL